MKFKPGDIVKIVPDPNASPEEKEINELWLGYQATVMQPEVTEHMLFGGKPQTKLEPIEERPDAHESNLDPYRWFYWITEELELVSHATPGTD